MALHDTTSVSAITVLEDGQLQIRRSRRVYDDSQLIAEQYHRHVVVPGDDISSEDPRVRLLCAALWTSDVIAAYRTTQQHTKP